MDAYYIAFPWFTNFSLILGGFLLVLIISHLLFLRAVPLGSIGWKRVDYVWLSMALLGMLGTVGASRETVAKNMLDIEKARLSSARRFVEMRAEFGTSEAVCRQFVRSEYSPAPDSFTRIQREYDAQCEWFKKALSALRNQEIEADAPIALSNISDSPPQGGDQGAYQSFLDSIASYNSILQGVQELQRESKPTELESVVQMLGPVLIALALALRMTKVSAEIRSERAMGKS